MSQAQQWIDRLQLIRHPEGGWYRETYRSAGRIAQAALPSGYSGDRAFATSIYYLLEAPDFSSWHRIRSDELWHFHVGTTLLLHLIDPSGNYARKQIGIDGGAQPQALAPAGWLFAASLADNEGFALVGCTVAPGFDFADFELPTRDTLLAKYPEHGDILTAWTRR